MTTGDGSSARSALGGLRVVELWPTLAGAQVGHLFADFGAEVVQVEPAGGSPLRRSPAFPFVARGKRSVALDLRAADDVRRATELAAAADVVVETFRPGVADSLGLGHHALRSRNPRLVHTSITGFPGEGPYAHVQGYEGLVMAKIGGSDVLSHMAPRPGPAFASVPFCTFSAAQTALQGTLAALLLRERTGRGQHVETSLVEGIAAHDTWNWFLYLLTTRYPDAFMPAPHIEDGVPNSALVFRLLVALSRDGHWLQFSQTSRHLFVALLRALDLDWMLDDPDWRSLPQLEDPARRVELWDRMVVAARARSLDEWRELFAEDANVWAEVFRTGPELLDHPQMVHDGNVLELWDAERGPVRQPAALVRMSATPARPDRSAPLLDADRDVLAAWAPADGRSAPEGAPTPPADAPTPADAPLSGVTVLELGMYFAAPFAGALLADLGARVIKIETLEGEPMRMLASFPEVGAIKLLQGKESVALDLGSAEGRAVVHELARRCDVVVQSFRAGVAERLGVDGPSLLAVNPDLVYLNAPGYGVDGPCGHRPAYAPTIAAATGVAWRMVGTTFPEETTGLTTDEVKAAAGRMVSGSNAAFAQGDGLSALGVATAAVLGLVARQRGAGGQVLCTSMLHTVGHANCEDVVTFEDRPPTPTADSRLLGLHALYRLYPTAGGWVFLAAPSDKEWARLTGVADFSALAGDARFADGPTRRANDGALEAALEAVLAGRTATQWELRLTEADVGCVAVSPGSVESVLSSDEFGRASGLVCDVVHPMLGEHPRLAPLVRFSDAATTPRPGCTLGQHTAAVLAELGYGPDRVEALFETKVAGGARALPGSTPADD